MKKIIIAGLLTMGALASCNDFLDLAPQDKFTDTPEYWDNTVNLEDQCNLFYEDYLGYGNADGQGWFYYKTLSDDQVDFQKNDWAWKNAPATSSDWKDAYKSIRHANFILKRLSTSRMDEDDKANFQAIARLNRAWQYYQLVRMFGNVPLVISVPDHHSDNILYGPRVDRDVVMDSVAADLNFATKHIAGTNKQRFTKNMAYAMLADVALYEGTYCKYRKAEDNAGKGPDATRAKTYLNACVEACKVIMGNAAFKLNDTYQGNYNSTDLSKNPEIIFYKPYSKNTLMHSLIDYTVNTGGTNGMTKDAFDNYLFLDGKPRASTALNKTDAPKMVIVNVQKKVDGVMKTVQDTSYNIKHLFAVRDKRLSVTLDTVLAFKGKAFSRAGSNAFTSTTGYGVAKYDNPQLLTTTERNNINRQYTDAPIYWLSVIYLNYAEAMAELGTITQNDLNKSVNLLQARAGLPNMTLTPDADPANNMGVSNLLWEIRRARRCELMFDNWYRYWDLIRWHQLELVDSKAHPNIYRGANMTTVDKPQVELDTLNNAAPWEVYMVGSNTRKQVRTYDKKYYFYPIPTGQKALNGNLEQNPGW